MLDATAAPPERTLVLNGVAVPTEELEPDHDLYPDHEDCVVDALRRYVRRGDRVVVVGGGWGVTTVVAARMTHFEGEVTTYEPSEKMRGYLRRAVEVNRVADLVTVENAAVGTVSDASERIFGEAAGASISPTELPECDVLDLDCEGAELEILRNLQFRPRLLTVEAHPHLGCPVDEVEATLVETGYELLERQPIRPGSDIENLVARRR